MYSGIILGKRRSPKKILILFLFFILFGFGFFIGFFYAPNQNNLSFSPQLLLKSQWFYSGELQEIQGFSSVFPMLPEGEFANVVWDISYDQDQVSKKDIPVFVSTATKSPTALVRVPREPLALTALMGDSPQVLIYSTHTSEGYDGGGTVVDVAHNLAEALETQYGILSVVSDTVHDSPQWYKSYVNSRQTAAKMLEEYPDAALLIDLHRDSGKKKEASTLDIDGVNAGELLLVVGSNLTMKHPNWEENLVTARALGECIKGVNSNILSGVRVQKGRYNQDLTSKAVLLEFGTNLNTLEEVKVSASVVAEAIYNYLQS